MQDHQKESKRGHPEIQSRDHTRNHRGVREPEEIPKNAEARPRWSDHTHRQSRMEVSMVKIRERVEEFYTELYDSTIIQTDPKEVPEVTSWEVEAALRDMKNGASTGNDHINIDTLTAGADTIPKTLATLYTKCLSDRRIHMSWMNAKMVIILKKGKKKDLTNYRPICLLSNTYEVLKEN